MQPFPHHYTSKISGQESGHLLSQSPSCPDLHVAEPKEFGGNGEAWSPEQLFVTTVASCLILTFRVIAKASKFTWKDISCDAQGKLDRVDGANQFTHIDISVSLAINSEDDLKKAHRILTKAENQCLVKNSICSEVNFKNEIIVC
ncbi:MAG: OsmC family protein [Pseudomonadota bacterium]